MIPQFLLGWPGLVILLAAAAAVFATDVLREKQTPASRRIRVSLVVAIVMLTVAGAVVTIARFDALTGGLLT